MEYFFYGRNGHKDFSVASAELPAVFDEITQYSEAIPDSEQDMVARICEVYACQCEIREG